MAYTLNAGSADFSKTTSTGAIVNADIVINGGTIKGGGGNGTNLKTIDLVDGDQLKYGSQVVVTDNVTGSSITRGNEILANNQYSVMLTNVALADNAESPKINETKAVRTSRVALAVKAGYWNIFTGEFDVAPTGVNDFAAAPTGFGSDQEVSASSNGRGLKGQFTYATQGNPVNEDYDPFTT